MKARLGVNDEQRKLHSIEEHIKLQQRMDPVTSYKLKFRLMSAYCRTDVSTRGWYFSKFVDAEDNLRLMIMQKFDQRRVVGSKLEGTILPHILSELKLRSHKLNYSISRSGDDLAEVSSKCWTFTKELEDFRHVVALKNHTYTCREWQVRGKPCTHAIAFITHLREEPFEPYVHECYSVQKFKAAYEGKIPALVLRKHWPKKTHGFFMYPPLQGRVAGRPRKERIKGSLEPGTSKSRKGSAHQCVICKQYGHHWNTCKDGDPEEKAALAEIAAKRKAEKAQKKRLAEAAKALCLGESSKKWKRSKSLDSSTLPASGSGSNTVEGPQALAIMAAPTEESTQQVVVTPLTKQTRACRAKKPAGAAVAASKKKGKKGNNTKKTALKPPPVPPKATSTKRTIPTPAPDSPAMGTRSKKKLLCDL